MFSIPIDNMSKTTLNVWQKSIFKYSKFHLVAGILIVFTVSTPLLAGSTTQQRGGDEICETLPSEIHLIKGIYDELRLI